MWDWTLSWISNYFSSNTNDRYVYMSSYVCLTSKVIKVSGLAYIQATVVLEYNDWISYNMSVYYSSCDTVCRQCGMDKRDVETGKPRLKGLSTPRCGLWANYLASLSFSSLICSCCED